MCIESGFKWKSKCSAKILFGDIKRIHKNVIDLYRSKVDRLGTGKLGLLLK